MSKDPFYESDAWRVVRYRALKLSNGCCDCCGARANKDKPLHVDHIKPRSKHPQLEIDISNLQVLCADCNLGKSAWDETDWRTVEAKKEKRWEGRILPAITGEHTYLVRKRGKNPRAHIIVNGDTACRLYSTGGILSGGKYEVIDVLAEHHSICAMCARSAQKNVA